MTGELIEIVQ